VTPGASIDRADPLAVLSYGKSASTTGAVASAGAAAADARLEVRAPEDLPPVIDVPNLDAALEWAARHPAAGVAFIEVRPILGFGVAPAKPA